MLNFIFRLVEKESDLSDESKSFAPEMTHQIYGENEVVFGYKVIHFKWLLLFQYGFETDNIISPGLEPVLSNTEKYCIRSYYRQFFKNIKIKILKLIPVLLACAFDISRRFSFGGSPTKLELKNGLADRVSEILWYTHSASFPMKERLLQSEKKISICKENIRFVNF